jgi:hypothetical protein
MKQSIHIFLKDAYCLRIEIGVFALLAAILAWAGGRVAESQLLLEAGAIYLITRVVHAEPIPGDRQFWLTRPYNRMSLAGAKLLFIAAFICAPICAAQLVMLLASGFPLLPAIPGLLWSQALIFFVGSFLVAALASITSSTVILMLALLLLGAAVITGETLYFIRIAEAQTHLPQSPYRTGWIRQYAAFGDPLFVSRIDIDTPIPGSCDNLQPHRRSGWSRNRSRLVLVDTHSCCAGRAIVVLPSIRRRRGGSRHRPLAERQRSVDLWRTRSNVSAAASSVAGYC